MKKIFKLLCVLLSLCFMLCQFSFIVIAEKDERTSVPLPVIMYHDIIKSSVRRDIYTITPEAFEEDIKWLKNNGYQTVGIQEIIDYVENGAKLPDKPVMLTFDDGHYNNIYYAEPILAKYGMKGVIFVTGEFCDISVKEGVKNPAYSYIFWEEQKRMAESGIWDVENHTYYLHRIGKGYNGIAKLKSESEADYREL